MSSNQRNGRSARPSRNVQRTLKIGLALLALFLVGAMSAGALAGGGAFSALGALTGSSSDETTSESTSTDSTTAAETTDGANTETTGETTTSSSPAPVVAPYIVTFAAGVSDTAARSVLAAAGATVESHIAVLRMYSVTLPTDQRDALAADSSVSRVDDDQPRDIAGTPDDTDYPSQWALPRIGWDQVYGSVDPAGSATVAVLDTGVDASQPDLDGKLVAGTSILDGSAGTTDTNGHGTSMAGIVAAATNNGAGIAGVGYAGVKVMPVTVLGTDGTGQDSSVIEGVVYAADHGADVILMSFSNPGYSASLQAAVDYAWSKGAVLVAATGNDGSSDADLPGGRPRRRRRREHRLDGSPLLDLQLRRRRVPRRSGREHRDVGGVRPISGTSASAAIVAGSAALMKAASVGISNGVIVSRLARDRRPGRHDLADRQRPRQPGARDHGHVDGLDPACGCRAVGGGGPFVGPYVVVAAAENLEAWGNTSTHGSALPKARTRRTKKASRSRCAIRTRSMQAPSTG